MSPPGPKRRASARRRQLERERRRRLLAAAAVLTVLGLVILLVSAFGGGSGTSATAPPAPASASRLVPAGPPQPEIVAKLGALHLQLPVSQTRVTAIGYQSGGDGALALDPLGTQANQGLLRRVVHAILGSSSGQPRWYQLPSGDGTPLSALDVGAPAGSDVYSPVDGTIVSITKVVLNGRASSSRVDLQPSSAPSFVVEVSNIDVDPSLVVGGTVTAGGSRLGSIVDLSRQEHQALAQYTNDVGNHVEIEVHPAAALALD
jgi:hypothetical protein